MSDQSKSPTIQFLVGLGLGLLPSGLQMIGVAINLWLGAAILLAAFVFVGRAFWMWERSSRWHVILRVLTVLVALVAYVYLIGGQIMIEYRREHVPLAPPATPEISRPHLESSPSIPELAPKETPRPPQRSAKKTPPAVETIKIVSQEQISSDNPKFPYALKVVVQTNVRIQPVSIVFEFTAPIGEGSVWFGGEEAIMFIKERSGPLVAYPNEFLASFESPAFVPEKAMIITVKSNEPIKASGRFQKVPFSFP